MSHEQHDHEQRRQHHERDHQHDHQAEAPLHTAEFWDERYGSTGALWSGEPNQRLVENVADLTPGTALELGCGEGADAIWLARQGWTVTAVDVSAVALERAAAHAEAVGRDVAERVTWRREDLREWAPEPRSFDLVTESFLHLPAAVRGPQHRLWADAVRPGGTFLVVGHRPDAHRHEDAFPADMFFTAEEEAARLPADEWDITTSSPTRDWHDPEGHPMVVTDAVLRAVRR